MNSKPTTTGAVAVSAAMISSIITWLAGLAHVQMPDQVSGALAALILWLAHAVYMHVAKE